MQSDAQNNFGDMQQYAAMEKNGYQNQSSDASVSQQQLHHNDYQPSFNANLPPAPAMHAAGDAFPTSFGGYQPYNTTTPATPGDFVGDAFATEYFSRHQPQSSIPQGVYAYDGRFVNNFGELPMLGESVDGYRAWPGCGEDASVHMQTQAEMQMQAQWRAQMQPQVQMQVQDQLQAQAQYLAQAYPSPDSDFAPNHPAPAAPFAVPDRPPAPAPASPEDDFNTKIQLDDAAFAQFLTEWPLEQTVNDYHHRNGLYQDMLSSAANTSVFPANDLALFPVNFASAKAAQDATLNRTSDYGWNVQGWVPTGTQSTLNLEQAGWPVQDYLPEPTQQLDCQAEAVGPSQEIGQPMAITSAKEEAATPEPLFATAPVAKPRSHRAGSSVRTLRASGELVIVDIKDARDAKKRFGRGVTPVVLYAQAVRPEVSYQPRMGSSDAPVICPVDGCRRLYTSNLRAVERHLWCSKDAAHIAYVKSDLFAKIKHYSGEAWGKAKRGCKFCGWETQSGRGDSLKRHEMGHMKGRPGLAKPKRKVKKESGLAWVVNDIRAVM
ncbi:unnamed protein product [Peniophora sp. CBMAI 1063]|nr:unnamed protein product [Peniophora sp. CBMAI 1063]